MIAVVNQEAEAEGHSVDQSTLIKVWFQFSCYIETLRFSLTSCSCLLDFFLQNAELGGRHRGAIIDPSL